MYRGGGAKRRHSINPSFKNMVRIHKKCRHFRVKVQFFSGEARPLPRLHPIGAYGVSPRPSLWMEPPASLYLTPYPGKKTHWICSNLGYNLWKNWDGHIHPSPPRSDAPEGGTLRRKSTGCVRRSSRHQLRGLFSLVKATVLSLLSTQMPRSVMQPLHSRPNL